MSSGKRRTADCSQLLDLRGLDKEKAQAANRAEVQNEEMHECISQRSAILCTVCPGRAHAGRSSGTK